MKRASFLRGNGTALIDSFSYDDSYANYNPDDPSSHISGYFIDSYGMTFATEDRSEIFGTAIDNYINGIYDDARFTDDSPIRNKLDYYSRCIRDGFDTKDWRYDGVGVCAYRHRGAGRLNDNFRITQNLKSYDLRF